PFSAPGIVCRMSQRPREPIDALPNSQCSFFYMVFTDKFTFSFEDEELRWKPKSSSPYSFAASVNYQCKCTSSSLTEISNRYEFLHCII
ncbi:hypothetical protein H5410_043251, partial [Solanum commersonii]